MKEEYCPECGSMDEKCFPDCPWVEPVETRQQHIYTLPEAFIQDKEVPTRWRVWAVINGFFIGGQRCWASNEWIGKQVKSHKDTVSQAIKELEDNKIIRCTRGARSRSIYPMIGINAYQWSASAPTSDRRQHLPNSVSNSVKEYGALEDELRVVKEDSLEEQTHSRKKPKYPNAVEVFECWGAYPKNWMSLKKVIQRESAQNLYDEHGIEEIKNALVWYGRLKDVQYCPRITCPEDLDTKWGALEAFVEKN